MSGREIMVGDKPLSSLRVVDLKAELDKRSLSKSGSKKDLFDRLKAALVREQKREEAAVKDEEELPNISVTAKLPDDNPFVREYLTSQAELFHSQKVAKMLYREEQKRESEGSGASADERERSPIKSPSKLSESPTFTPNEDKADSTANSSDREKLPEKRSTRNRPAPTLSTETENPKSNEDAKIEEPLPPSSTKPIPKIPETVEKQKASPVPEESTPEVEISKERDEVRAPPPRSSKRGRKASEQIVTEETAPAPTSKLIGEDPASEETSREKSAERRSTRSRATTQPTLVIEEVTSDDKISEAQLPLELTASTTESITETKEMTETTKEEEVVTEETIKQDENIPVVETEEVPATQTPIAEDEVEVEPSSPKKESDQKSLTIETGKSKEKSPPPKRSTKRTEQLPPPVPVETEEKLDKVEVIPVKQRTRRSRFLTEEEQIEMDLKTKQTPQNENGSGLEKRLPAQSEEEPMDTEPIPVSSQEKVNEVQEIITVITTVESKKLISEIPLRKIRAHSPITAPEPDIKSDTTESKKEAESLKRSNSTVEKESILDEVLDYGEEEDVTLLEGQSGSTVKKTSIVSTRSRLLSTKEDVTEKDNGRYDPINFVRRVLNLKPNRHTQRRKDKLVEDRKTREKEKEKGKVPDYMITSDLLVEWFPDMVLLTDEEVVRLEAANPLHGNGEDKVRITRTISNVGSFEGEEIEVEEEQEQPEMDLSIQRKISLVSMDEEISKTEQTPPRRAPTQFILVTNLTRPFTLTLLKELLQRTGTVVDLWVDKIKSRCVAKYDTEDEAMETRTALHGVKWPSSNPKTLSVDFTTEERAEDLRKKDSGYIEEKPVASQHVREWDMGKKSPPRQSKKRSRSAERLHEREGHHHREGERAQKRSRRSRSGSRSRSGIRRGHSRSPHSDRKDRNGDVKKSESSGKTLDELFRKTVAVPCIYWLPLDPQQILEKEELRRKRMEERERRIAELQNQRSQHLR